MTTRDTLARNPHTYFAAMLRMHTPTTPPGGGGSGSGGGGSGRTSVASASGDEDKSGTPVAATAAGAGEISPGAAAAAADPTSSSSSAGEGMEFFIDRDPTHFRWVNQRYTTPPTLLPFSTLARVPCASRK